jgi:hypothetical protein
MKMARTRRAILAIDGLSAVVPAQAATIHPEVSKALLIIGMCGAKAGAAFLLGLGGGLTGCSI